MKKYNKETKKFDLPDERNNDVVVFEKLSNAGIYVELSTSGVYVKDKDVLTADNIK